MRSMDDLVTNVVYSAEVQSDIATCEVEERINTSQ